MIETTEATAGPMAAEDTRCVLIYREMIVAQGGLFERGEATVLGDEDGNHVEEWCVCDSDGRAINVFLDNLTDPGALGMEACSEQTAEEVTASEDFHGWGTVVRHSWTTEEGEHQSRLYSAVTRSAAEWLAEIAE